MASAGYSELPEEITNSPMIDRNESFTFITGMSSRLIHRWMSVRLVLRRNATKVVALDCSVHTGNLASGIRNCMAERSLAFKCRKWRIGGQQQVMQ